MTTPGFSTTYWTTVLQQYPTFITRYPNTAGSPDTTTTAVEITTTTTTTPGTTDTTTTTLSFTVPDSDVGSLIPYYNDFVNTLSDATGIPRDQIFPTFQQVGDDVVITYNINGDYQPQVTDPDNMEDFIENLSNVPGLK